MVDEHASCRIDAPRRDFTDVGPCARQRSPLSQSIRWRIQVWHAVILAIVILLFVVGTYLHQRRVVLGMIDDELSAAVEVLLAQVSIAEASDESAVNLTPSDTVVGVLRRLTMPETFAPRRYRHDFELPYFAVWAENGDLITASRTNDLPPAPDFSEGDSQNRDRPASFDRRFLFRDRSNSREATWQSPAGLTVLAGRWVQKDFERLNQLLLTLVAGGTLLFVLGTAGGWLLSRTSVAPLHEISRVAARISDTNLNDRIDVGGTDSELTDLAHTLNATFARLQQAFERQRQFTADASHELRTPLSVVQMHQELALSKERTPAEYRDAIATCQRATTRMNTLVESLLTLARLETPESQLERSRIELSAVVDDCVRQLIPLARANHVVLECEVAEAWIVANRDQLAQVVTNLLTNAVAYTPAEGRITITVLADGSHVEIVVTDTGCGIPLDAQEQIFERFYRVDQQRSRDSGGSGLGLSICRTIVEAHDGTIAVESSPDAGATFRIRLPAAESTTRSP